MYDRRFFDSIRNGSRRSAEIVCPLIATMLNHRSNYNRVVDVGCGEGWWGEQFRREGCDVVGIDHLPDDANPEIKVIDHDLRKPIAHHSRAPDIMAGQWDLALSLEVAEHLPPERGVGFIDELCALAPIVVFSAAVPGQGGTGHLNEQWPSYWAAQFRAREYYVTSDLRWEIWGDRRIEWWYRQNILVAFRDPAFSWIHSDEVPDVIHPEMARHRGWI